MTNNQPANIAAIVLAAGTSSRYGGPNKLLLPFGKIIVLRQSAGTVIAAGVQRVLVVTGHQREQIEDALQGIPVEFVHNPRYAEGEMVSSIKAGLSRLDEDNVDAALVTLGDQPLLPGWVIQRLLHAYRFNCGDIIAPKFGKVRGHPVLIARKWWREALALPDGAPMRTLLNAHPEAVTHLLVNTDAVIKDVDTPELYAEAMQAVSRDSALSTHH